MGRRTVEMLSLVVVATATATFAIAGDIMPHFNTIYDQGDGLVLQGGVQDIALASDAMEASPLPDAMEASPSPDDVFVDRGERVCQIVGNEYDRKILLQDGFANDIVDFSIFIEDEDPSRFLTVAESSNNTRTLAADGTDTVVSQMISDYVPGGLLYNFSVEVEFDKCPGLLYYELKVIDRGDVVCKFSIDYIVSGLCITSTEPDGRTMYLTGRTDGNSLGVGNQANSALGNSFETYIVFPNGETSDVRLPNGYNLSSIEVTPVIGEEQVKYDFLPDGECDIGAGVYTGEFVRLDNDQCQMGFTQNAVAGSWPGVFFGINFEADRLGDFGFRIVWPEFSESNPVLDELFETFFFIHLTSELESSASPANSEGFFDGRDGNVSPNLTERFMVVGRD